MTTKQRSQLAVYVSPADIAASRGVNVSKVLTWIKNGELKATNVATRLGGMPRWRISPADLEAFDAARAAVPIPAPARRRKRSSGVVEFF